MTKTKEIVTQPLAKKGHEEKIILQCITGKVIYATKHIWSDTYGGGRLSDGYGDINIDGAVNYFDQLFLLDNDGREHAFQCKNLNIATRESHVLTVMSKDETCIAVLNHSTRKKYFNDYYIEKILRLDYGFKRDFQEKNFNFTDFIPDKTSP